NGIASVSDVIPTVSTEAKLFPSIVTSRTPSRPQLQLLPLRLPLRKAGGNHSSPVGRGPAAHYASGDHLARLQASRHSLVARRLYFFRPPRRRWCGGAWTVFPLIPVMVSAATSELRIASSVAWTVASKTGLRSSFESMVRPRPPPRLAAPGLAVENAR